MNAGGDVVATAASPYTTSRPQRGAAEQEPEDWCAATRQAMGALVASAGQPIAIAGIGLAGMIPTLVVADGAGKPVGPAITWEDGRAEAEGAALRDAVGAEALYAATGQRVDGRYLLPMYMRLARADADRVAEGLALLGAKDFLFEWLTGVRATDPSTATGYGCYDLRAGRWHRGVLGACGLCGTRLVRQRRPARPLPRGGGLRAPCRSRGGESAYARARRDRLLLRVSVTVFSQSGR